MISRRELMVLGSAGLLLPSRLARAADGDERVFLFVFVEGGWDPAFVFTPMFGTGAWEEEGATTSVVGGHTLVDHQDRPLVRDFFQRFGDQVSLVHGLELPSVTHERCRQLLWTGSAATGPADWPTRLADASQDWLGLPHLVVDGPSYAGELAHRVVRAGDSGQLAKLLSGEFTGSSGRALSSTSRARVHAALAERSAILAAEPGVRGEHARLYGNTLDDLRELRAWPDLELASQTPGCTRDFQADFELAFTAFEEGLTRCAMLRHQGWCDQGWDTHQRLELQSANFEDLFEKLGLGMDLLASRPSLQERLVVVVASEMGRHPLLNAWEGKDHWTWTSLMIWGAGVRGGLSVGGLDDEGRGRPVDLGAGQATDSGTPLGPEHLGATLFALADLEPDAAPIEALLA